MSLTASWNRLLECEIPAWPLARTRIVIGLLAFARGFEGWRVLHHVTSPDTLRLPYLVALPHLTRAELPWLAGLWLIAAAAFTVGWRTRIAGATLCLVIARVLTADQQAYSNHLYLLLLLVFILTCGESAAIASLDARRSGPREQIPGWPIWLLALQGSIVYAYAALAKLIPEYLSGAVLCLHLGWLDRHPPPVMVCAALAAGSVLIELFLAVSLWRARLWALACVVGIGLHVAMVMLLSSEVRFQLIIFAGEMLVLYPLYPMAGRLVRGARAAGAAIA